MKDSGSSPHLRGTHCVKLGVRVRDRFIPAPAGNTARSCMSRGRRSVHPRTCGEHYVTLSDGLLPIGSSPHLRGTLRPEHQPHPLCRFIPAPAGNTLRWQTVPNPSPVHPRTCGEHVFLLAGVAAATGSSPHLRGTRGKGLQTGRQRLVHPRTCGEHIESTASSTMRYGSSPHLRGTPPSGWPVEQYSRFIPAPAGNTRPATPPPPPPPVHPRTCGEHTARRICQLSPTGSSPHLRGTRAPASPSRSGKRFIPAPAGNTLASPHTRLWRSVHPRTCGEHRVSQTL